MVKSLLLAAILVLLVACSESVDEIDLSGLEVGAQEEEWGLTAEVLDGSCSYHLYVDSCDGPEHLVMYCFPGLNLTNNSGKDAVLTKLAGTFSWPHQDAPCAEGIDVETSTQGDLHEYELPITISDGKSVTFDFYVGYETDEHLSTCEASPWGDVLVLTVRMTFEVRGKERTVTVSLTMNSDVWEDYDACVLGGDWPEEE